MRDLGISLDLFSISHKGQADFDMESFWIDILFLFGVDEGELFSSSSSSSSRTGEKVDELMTLVRRKENRKRALARMRFTLGEGMEIAIKLFSLLMEAKKGHHVWVDGETGEPMKPFTEYVNPQTGALVDTQSMRYYLDFGGSKAIFTKEETVVMKDFGPPGLTLIGFKDRTAVLALPLTLTHSTFVHPDEFEVRGSICVFSALLATMLRLDRVALCRCIPRKGAPPRLVVLVPQLEILDDAGTVSLPGGFHLIVLPFADDIRTIKLTDAKIKDHISPGPDQLRVLGEVMEKLKLTSGFDPQAYENPALQKHFANLQALALEHDVPNHMEDQTVPKVAAMLKRAGKQLQELITVFPGEDSEGNKRASPEKEDCRTAESPLEPSDIVKGLETIDDKNELQRYTVKELKEYLVQGGVEPGRLKADIVQQVLEYNKKI